MDELAEFSIHHKPRIKNTVVDALSKYTLVSQESLKVFRAACQERKV